MSIFERFKGGGHEGENLKEPLIPDFKEQEEVEKLIERLLRVNSDLSGFMHDDSFGFDREAEEDRVEKNPKLRPRYQEYLKLDAEYNDLEKNHLDNIREYLTPYFDIYDELSSEQIKFPPKEEGKRMTMVSFLKSLDGLQEDEEQGSS